MRSEMNGRRIGILVALAFTITSFAQGQKQTAPPPQTDAPKQELGPTTSKTKEEIDAAKTLPRETVITAAPVDPKKYVIGPEDIIRVNVWKDTDFTGVFQVRPDGKFSMNLIGDITAAGLTPDQLAQDISKALEQYLVKPQVNVSVAQVLSKNYYITGEVNRTGKFPLVVPTTIMEALTNAGGFREYAKTKKIVIMRGKERIKFSYNDVIKGKNLEQNILLQDGDYVHVP